MIEVKLSVEEYNRLFMLYFDRDFDDIFCKVQNDKIIFADDRRSNDAIARVNLNTPEGKILSNYTECQLRISMNNNEDIFLHETCMNPDDPYIGHCYNCNVNHCQYSYGCRKGMIQKFRSCLLMSRKICVGDFARTDAFVWVESTIMVPDFIRPLSKAC